VELAHRLGFLERAARDRVLSLLRRVGLPTFWPGIDPLAMHASLQSIARHPDGHLNLVMPVGVGRSEFLTNLSDVNTTLLVEALQGLSNCTRQDDEKMPLLERVAPP